MKKVILENLNRWLILKILKFYGLNKKLKKYHLAAKKLDNLFLCKYCQGGLEIPKFLPCCETICSLCETSIQVDDYKFDCFVRK